MILLQLMRTQVATEMWIGLLAPLNMESAMVVSQQRMVSVLVYYICCVCFHSDLQDNLSVVHDDVGNTVRRQLF